MSCSKSSRKDKFLFSNALDLDIVIDNILEHLPIRIAARVSVLSKQWRRAWLSLKSLRFDANFWEEQNRRDGDPNWTKCSSIISSILLHHNGPVHDFYLHIPHDKYEVEWKMFPRMNHSQWLSFLSKNGVRKIVIINRCYTFDISSYIFCCTTLVQLKLFKVEVDYPLTDFSGFPNLKHLDLETVYFREENAFCRMVANCSMLSTLKIDDWDCLLENIVIDIPSLQTFIFSGSLLSLAFRNVRSLKNISVRLTEMSPEFVTIDSVNNLANSCQLQSIKFNGEMCKFLLAGVIRRSLPVSFSHVTKLSVRYLKRSEFGSGDLRFLHYIVRMIESCPNIKKLKISVSQYFCKPDAIEPEPDYNNSLRLNHLLEIKIKGVKGSSPELKLIEYLLAVSTVLEKLSFKPVMRDAKSRRKLSRKLMGLPKASSKACLFEVMPLKICNCIFCKHFRSHISWKCHRRCATVARLL